MKKEVQALIKRRRARLFPVLMLSVAGLILLAIVALVTWLFSQGVPGIAAATDTLTPPASATATLRPSATIAIATDLPTETPTVTSTAGPSPTATPIVYTVQQGDTMFSIAEQFRANVCYMMVINGITDPSVLAVGQTLIIPAPDYLPPTATSLPTSLPRGARVEYVVQCGDTLESIASLFNSTAEDIASQNRDLNDPLQIGDVVIVRVNLVTPTPTATLTVTAGVPATAGTAVPTGTVTAAP